MQGKRGDAARRQRQWLAALQRLQEQAPEAGEECFELQIGDQGASQEGARQRFGEQAADSFGLGAIFNVGGKGVAVALAGQQGNCGLVRAQQGEAGIGQFLGGYVRGDIERQQGFENRRRGLRKAGTSEAGGQRQPGRGVLRCHAPGGQR